MAKNKPRYQPPRPQQRGRLTKAETSTTGADGTIGGGGVEVNNRETVSTPDESLFVARAEINWGKIGVLSSLALTGAAHITTLKKGKWSR